MTQFAREQVGKPYDFVGVVMHAPFALQRRVCELPGVPTVLREACLSTLATFQLIHGGDDRFFCSQFVLESYRVAGLPITRRPAALGVARGHHAHAGGRRLVAAGRAAVDLRRTPQVTVLAIPLPGFSIPLPLPPSGEARTPGR